MSVQDTVNLFPLSGYPDFFPQVLSADSSGTPLATWAMINWRKDNTSPCSSKDLYKRLVLTQPESPFVSE